MRHVPPFLAAPALVALVAGCPAGAPVSADAPRDTYVVELDRSARTSPATGRVILFLVAVPEGGRAPSTPAAGPFWEPPQPIASVAARDLSPGARIELGGDDTVASVRLAGLSGRMRVQAVLDVDDTERDHREGPGNVLSDVIEVDLDPGRADVVTLHLTRVVPTPEPRRDGPGLQWVRVRSELLSAFYGRDVYHRAGVALPPAHGEDDEGARWPAIYRIPGYGGRDDGARMYARMLRMPRIAEIAPLAVYVSLDPESPLGHHGFVDSPNHGPRGTALVTELIPYLEQRFGLVARPEGRLVTGHSSGGWSSLWLQLRWPEVFGGCWSSAPDPVDFSAFQMTDLYRDASLFEDAEGRPSPSLRRLVGMDGESVVVMTVREECAMEHAIDPTGGSGQQWDAWTAMFSPRDPSRDVIRPLAMFDPGTGTIDRAVVTEWARFDVTRLVRADWERHGPTVMQRVRLLCGEHDSFYLDRAVRRFKATVETLAAADGGWSGPGYVEIVPDATHGTITNLTFQRINREMREHLRQAGLARGDEDSTPSAAEGRGAGSE